MPPQNLERADDICITGSPLTPRRVNEVRADTGGLGRSKCKILGGNIWEPHIWELKFCRTTSGVNRVYIEDSIL